MNVLHVAPHPDDELIGAPAALMALRDAGHRIVNFAASLGAAADAERRRRELTEACRRAGFHLLVSQRPFGSTSTMNAAARRSAEQALAAELDAVMAAGDYELVVGPSPHDRHPAHELVGRATRLVLERTPAPARWWMWSVWGVLPTPTLLVGFDADRLREISHALEAHEGEIARNDYVELVECRGRVGRVVGSEVVFGFGVRVIPEPLAELVCEVVIETGQWRLGSPRRLDPREPFRPPSSTDIGWWLDAPSVTDRLSRTG